MAVVLDPPPTERDRERYRALRRPRPRPTMNRVDRLVAVFDPEAGRRRLAARVETWALQERLRGFEAAALGRRLENWENRSAGPNSEIRDALSALRARSRNMEANTPLARNANQILTGRVVGLGVRPTATSKVERRNRRAMELWRLHMETTACDVDGRTTAYGIQDKAWSAVVSAGECLIRRRRRRPTDGLPLPFQLEVIEADQLDIGRNEIFRTRDGAPRGGILQGVEYDALGRRVAYWIHPEHPGDNRFAAFIGESKRVPARDVLHVFAPLPGRLGQVRGVPRAAPVLVVLKDWGDAREAEMMRLKVASCFVAFVHDLEAGLEVDGLPKNESGQPLNQVEPGMIEHLSPGKTVTFGNPTAIEGFSDYARLTRQEIAVGYGLSYASLTGDLTGSNYSSGRMGWILELLAAERDRVHTLEPQLCHPLWRWAMEAAVDSGQLDRDDVPVIWTPSRERKIDPEKEVRALGQELGMNLTTASEAIRRHTGRDPIEFLDELVADRKRLEDLDLHVGPSGSTSNGPSAPPTPPGPGADDEGEGDEGKGDEGEGEGDEGEGAGDEGARAHRNGRVPLRA